MEGKILRKLREKAGKTQKQVAEDLGYYTTTYARWEQDLNNMKLIDVINVAKYFNVSIDYIAGLTEEANPKASNKNITIKQEAIINIAERAENENRRT